MSRCFPFPPPGYEKKIRTDEAESLLKEKQKGEKKLKKEKKDKEKREGKEKKDKEKKGGKEKKDKETSKDKRKERKKKKEKHKDSKNKDRDKEKSRTLEDKKTASTLPNAGNREKLVANTLQNNGNGESKFIQDLARRIRDEEEATESQSPRNIGFPGGVKENKIACSVPQINHTKVDEKRINTHRNSAMEKGSENAVLRVSSCMDQKGAEIMVKPVEKRDQAKKNELQEKNHHRENVRKSDKPLDNGVIKKSEPKNITARSSKDEKTEVINKTGQEKPKFVEGGPRLKEREHKSLDTRNSKVQDLSRACEGILGKRKDLETNGNLYENGSRPSKIPRRVASPISSMENGRKLEACQTNPKPVSELQGALCKPEVKEHRINGFTKEPKSHHPPVSSVKENGKTSAKKRPHSDLKYLDQILNVPEREEFHDVDEQEWLFGQSSMELSKKQRLDSSTLLDVSLQIWDKALRIESADILALPYVIPF